MERIMLYIISLFRIGAPERRSDTHEPERCRTGVSKAKSERQNLKMSLRLKIFNSVIYDLADKVIFHRDSLER